MRRQVPRTRSGARRARWVLLVVVLVLVAALGGVAVLRPDLVEQAREALTTEAPPADPADDPAAVAPPPGLDLPAVEDPAPVVDPLTAAEAGEPDPAAVRAALRGPLGNGALGPHVVAGVASLDGRATVLAGDRDAAIPASTTKLATSIAALDTLGPGRRFTTSVVADPVAGGSDGSAGGPRRVVLVGGGDPLLELDQLRALARRTAQALRSDPPGGGPGRVRVAYDASYFTGPEASPTWEDDYLSSGVVSPISALWVDRGITPDGVRAPDPALAAAQAFAGALRSEGVPTVGAPAEGTAPDDAEELAEHTGLPVDLLVEHLNENSDNEVGEVLAHQVGLEVEGEASFAAGARAMTATLRDLGVDMTGSEVNDGSGLSRDNRFTATAVLDVLEVAAAADRPDLRATLTGLPVAGFSGSLASRFSTVDPAGLGRVRGKTGTLTGVSALAGVVTTADGAELAYFLSADRIDPAEVLDAIQALDRAAAALAACTCAR